MEAKLNTNERRVLGALLEKSLAQPEYYPMTENAIVAACNQKLNRDPVMDLDEGAVWEALESLREMGLVTTVLPGPGARVKRFKHEVETGFGWQRRERAVMTELLLRGPQTVGELRGRCSRFMPFDDLEAVTIVLDCLAQAESPWVRALPREPGRSAIRYTHLLYPPDEAPTDAGAAPGVSVSTSESSTTTAHSAAPSGMQAQIDNLQQEVAELQEALADVTRRLAALEDMQ